jgi:hypothetical protein
MTGNDCQIVLYGLEYGSTDGIAGSDFFEGGEDERMMGDEQSAFLSDGGL